MYFHLQLGKIQNIRYRDVATEKQQLHLLCTSSRKVKIAVQHFIKYHPAIQPDKSNIIAWTVLFIEQFVSPISWLL